VTLPPGSWAADPRGGEGLAVLAGLRLGPDLAPARAAVAWKRLPLRDRAGV